MNTLWIVSSALQWAAIGGLCVLVLSLVRQLGVVSVRLNPSAGLDVGDGPGPGTEVPEQEIELYPTGTFSVGGARARPLLTVFLSPDCSICTSVAGHVRAIAETYRDALDLLVVVQGTPRLVREFVETHRLDGIPTTLRQYMVRDLLPGSTPFGVALTDEGTVAARGVPNALEHLEEMIRAAEDGQPLSDGANPAAHSWGEALPLERQNGAVEPVPVGKELQ